MAKFAASIERAKAKSASASEGLRPPGPLIRGSAPGPRWGHFPHISIIRSRYLARGRAVPPQILRTRTATGYIYSMSVVETLIVWCLSFHNHYTT